MRTISRRASPFGLQVRRSRIHRRGVFTTKPIPAHRKVIEYAGERISMKEAIERYGRPHKDGPAEPVYIFHLRRNWVVDGAAGGNGAEIINHSCQPNLITRRTRNHIYYFSRRAIPAGDELTVDYGFSMKAAKAICGCGSPKCRGTINKI